MIALIDLVDDRVEDFSFGEVAAKGLASSDAVYGSSDRAHVIEPLVAGHEGRSRGNDWTQRRLAEWVTVPRSPMVIIEASPLGADNWGRYLAYTIFVATPEQSRLRRGLERDGSKHMLDHWRSWMAAEEHHFSGRCFGSSRSDVDGEPSINHSPEEEFVVPGRQA